MAKRYSSKSQLQNLGDLNPNASGSPNERGDTGLPPEAIALLNTISGTESAGSYNVIYRGDHFKTYDDHPKVWVKIPGTKKYSSAAGKYQFVEPTWSAAQKALGLKDFTPASQDKAAWWLAQRQYKSDTGRDLLTDLRSGGTKNMGRITTSLSKQWDSLPAGGQPLVSAGKFADRYNAHLGGAAGHPVPSVGVGVNDNGDMAPLPAPAPLAPKGSGIRVISVNPDGRAVNPADEAFNVPRRGRSVGLGVRPSANVGAVAAKAAGATARPDPIDVPTLREARSETTAQRQVKAAPAPVSRATGLNGSRTEINEQPGGFRGVKVGDFYLLPDPQKQDPGAVPYFIDPVPTGREKPGVTMSAPRSRNAAPNSSGSPDDRQGARSIVPTLGRSAEQIAQEEQNAILSGYRDVQDGQFPGVRQQQTFTPPPVKQPTVQVSGAQKVKTITQRPDGATHGTDLAGSSEMPVARPSVPDVPQAGLIPQAKATSPTDVPKYITVTQQVPVKAAGGASSAVARQTLDDIHDAREDAQVKAQFTTITRQQLNPEWVKQQQAPARPIPRAQTRPSPVSIVGTGIRTAAAVRPAAQLMAIGLGGAQPTGATYLQAAGINTQGMSAGQVGNELRDQMGGSHPGTFN